MVTEVKTSAKCLVQDLNHSFYLRLIPPGGGQGLNAYPFANSPVMFVAMLVAISQFSGDSIVGIGDAEFLGSLVSHGE
jgi:hypothetical protein